MINLCEQSLTKKSFFNQKGVDVMSRIGCQDDSLAHESVAGSEIADEHDIKGAILALFIDGIQNLDGDIFRSNDK